MGTIDQDAPSWLMRPLTGMTIGISFEPNGQMRLIPPGCCCNDEFRSCA